MKKIVLGMNVWKLLFLVMICAFLYLQFIATPRYESHARIIIKNSNTNPNVETFGSFVPLASSPTRQDALWVRDYLLGTLFLDRANEELSLQAHYAEHRHFPFSVGEFETDDFYQFYAAVTHIEFDEYAGVLDIRAQAFTKEMASKLINLQLAMSEEFINEMSHSIANRELRFAEDEMARHKAHLDDITHQISRFQKRTRYVDPGMEIASSQSAKASLEARLRELEASRVSKIAYLNEDAFDVIVIDREINMVNQQLSLLSDKSVLSQHDAVSDINHEFQYLSTKMEIAASAYRASVISVEQARLDSMKQLKHLIQVQEPNVALEPVYPSTLKSLFTVFCVSAMFMFGLSFLKASLREGIES